MHRKKELFSQVSTFINLCVETIAQHELNQFELDLYQNQKSSK